MSDGEEFLGKAKTLIVMCGFVMNIIYIIINAATDLDFFFGARAIGILILLLHIFSYGFFAASTFRDELVLEAIPCLCFWMIMFCIFPMQCLLAFVSVNQLKESKDFEFNGGMFFLNLFNIIYLGGYIITWCVAADYLKDAPPAAEENQGDVEMQVSEDVVAVGEMRPSQEPSLQESIHSDRLAVT